MTKKMAAEWNLKKVMEQHHFHSTTELVPMLAQRGVQLSRIQVYRLVAQAPLRLTLDLLAALCDIFACTPNDLITIKQVDRQERKKIAAAGETKSSGRLSLIKTRVHRPK